MANNPNPPKKETTPAQPTKAAAAQPAKAQQPAAKAAVQPKPTNKPEQPKR